MDWTASNAVIPRISQALGCAGVTVLIWLIGSLVAASLWPLAGVVAIPLVMVTIATTLDRRHPILRRSLLWIGIAGWLICLLTKLRFMFPPILIWKVLTQSSLCLLLLVAAASLKNWSEIASRAQRCDDSARRYSLGVNP